MTQVSEAVNIEANCVYVIPPGKHLLMADGQLILNDLPHEYGMRTAVDIFFRTLATLASIGVDFCSNAAKLLSYCGER
jgi:two-component system, chemotaxis family, CheB/CheR fusion protein